VIWAVFDHFWGEHCGEFEDRNRSISEAWQYLPSMPRWSFSFPPESICGRNRRPSRRASGTSSPVYPPSLGRRRAKAPVTLDEHPAVSSTTWLGSDAPSHPKLMMTSLSSLVHGTTPAPGLTRKHSERRKTAPNARASASHDFLVSLSGWGRPMARGGLLRPSPPGRRLRGYLSKRLYSVVIRSSFVFTRASLVIHASSQNALSAFVAG
jgi:hypothetical protein